MRKLLAIIIPLFLVLPVLGQETIYFSLAEMFPINDFKLEREANQAKNLYVIALKDDGQINQSIEGKYEFVINGFIEKLNFDKGKAIIPEEIGASVLYVKHETLNNHIYHLYYLFAGVIISIPLWLLIIIPILIVLIALFLKRIIFLLLFVLFVFFFLFQGIDFSAFMNLMKEAINTIF